MKSSRKTQHHTDKSVYPRSTGTEESFACLDSSTGRIWVEQDGFQSICGANIFGLGSSEVRAGTGF